MEPSDQMVQHNAPLAKAAGSCIHVMALQGGGLCLLNDFWKAQSPPGKGITEKT